MKRFCFDIHTKLRKKTKDKANNKLIVKERTINEKMIKYNMKKFLKYHSIDPLRCSQIFLKMNKKINVNVHALVLLLTCMLLDDLDAKCTRTKHFSLQYMQHSIIKKKE